MACPYYREPAANRLIGKCDEDPDKIPSEAHQSCLCRSPSIYSSFCPIYGKLQRQKNRMQKHGIFARLLSGSHRKHVYDNELEQGDLIVKEVQR